MKTIVGNIAGKSSTQIFGDVDANFKEIKLDVFGVNLYDKSQNTADKFIGAGASYIETANTTYNITGFIPVDNVNTFSLYNLGNIGASPRWAYFSEANNASFISAFALSSNTQPALVGVPANAKYVKASLHDAVIDTFRIVNEGLSKIEDNRKIIDSFTDSITATNSAMSTLSVDANVKNPLSYNIPPFIKSSNGVDSEFNAATVGTLDYYAAYDKLMMIFSWYIKKTVIGTSQTPEGIYATKDPTVYNINCYEFSALNLAVNAPKIILSAGIHGDSEGTGWYNNGGDKPQSIISLFYFLKDLCYNPSSNYFMRYLRDNVRILVVPVMNPWGVTNHSRGNGRNIDLNRNFDINFVANQLLYSSYTGSAAFSESETQAWKTFVEGNLNAKFIIESHSRGDIVLPSDNRYHMAYTDDAITSLLRDEIQLYMKKTYGGLYSGGGYTLATATSSQMNWAYYIKGIPCIEPEHFGSIANDITTLNSLETNMINAAYQAIVIQRFVAKYILGF